jgi:hypothetical protein
MSPLPEPPPFRSHAPKSAGVGLRSELTRKRLRFAHPDWPADWWQRNYDLPILDPDGPDPMPLTDRMMRIPPPPTPKP